MPATNCRRTLSEWRAPSRASSRTRGCETAHPEPSRTAIPGVRTAHGVVDGDIAGREIRGSTTILEILRMYPDGRAATLMSRIYWPCAHCGGAVREPLTLAAQRHARDPRAVLVAFRALEHGGPSDEEIAHAAARRSR